MFVERKGGGGVGEEGKREVTLNGDFQKEWKGG